MITKSALMAKPSKLGHKGFQYPDHEGQNIVIPKGTRLTELHWIGGGDWNAWVWVKEDCTSVVWTKSGENK